MSKVDMTNSSFPNSYLLFHTEIVRYNKSFCMTTLNYDEVRYEMETVNPFRFFLCFVEAKNIIQKMGLTFDLPVLNSFFSVFNKTFISFLCRV